MSVSMSVTTGITGPNAPDPTVPPKGTEDRPSWLPEGFDTPESFREAYDKLAATPHLAKPDPTKPDKPDPTKPAPKDPSADDKGEIKSCVEESGLNIDDLQKQVVETGDISPEALAKMEAAAKKRGFSEGTVKRFIEGEKAKAAEVVNAL
jgi:hypothetical protein